MMIIKIYKIYKIYKMQFNINYNLFNILFN